MITQTVFWTLSAELACSGRRLCRRQTDGARRREANWAKERGAERLSAKSLETRRFEILALPEEPEAARLWLLEPVGIERHEKAAPIESWSYA
jgi:hypothetical protein